MDDDHVFGVLRQPLPHRVGEPHHVLQRGHVVVVDHEALHLATVEMVRLVGPLRAEVVHAVLPGVLVIQEGRHFLDWVAEQGQHARRRKRCGDDPLGHVGQVEVVAVLLVAPLVLRDHLPGGRLELLLLRKQADQPRHPHEPEHGQDRELLGPLARGGGRHADDDEGDEDDGKVDDVVPLREEERVAQRHDPQDELDDKPDGDDQVDDLQGAHLATGVRVVHEVGDHDAYVEDDQEEREDAEGEALDESAQPPPDVRPIGARHRRVRGVLGLRQGLGGLVPANGVVVVVLEKEVLGSLQDLPLVFRVVLERHVNADLVEAVTVDDRPVARLPRRASGGDCIGGIMAIMGISMMFF